MHPPNITQHLVIWRAHSAGTFQVPVVRLLRGEFTAPPTKRLKLDGAFRRGHRIDHAELARQFLMLPRRGVAHRYAAQKLPLI